MQRWTTVSHSFRSRSQSRKRPCQFLEKVECPVPRPRGPAEPTEPAVGGLRCTRSHNRRSERIAVANHEQFGANRRLASSANGAKQQEHVAQVRAHRTAPPNRPAAAPIIDPSLHPQAESAISFASTGELLNTIGAIRKALVLAADVSALAAAHERCRSLSFRSDCGCGRARRSRGGLT
jgi:hypothetical protein